MNTKKIVVIGSYVYVMLPIFIFCLGWLRWYISIPTAALLLVSFIKAARSEHELWTPKWNRETVTVGAIMLVIIALWVYLSGVGGITHQNIDHWWRNRIFMMLVEKQWPVTMSIGTADAETVRGMIYYLGFWLPAALVGKALGVTAGFLFQLVWLFIGVVLVTFYVMSYFKSWTAWPLIGFIFFSGLDILGYYLTGNTLSAVFDSSHLEWWCSYAHQYSSNTTQLFWVFNQAVYAWLLLMMVMSQKSNRNMVLLMACGLIECTLPIIGLMPFTLYRMYKNWQGTDLRREWKREIFCYNNFVGMLWAVICAFYLLGNGSSQSIHLDSAVSLVRGAKLLYILFIMMEVGLYILASYRYHIRSGVFWLTLAVLLLCPLVQIGYAQDFCMRVSIPALMMLCLMVMETFRSSLARKDAATVVAIAALYLIGSVTPMHEIRRTIETSLADYWNQTPYLANTVTEDTIMSHGNFSGSVETSFFFQYLAK